MLRIIPARPLDLLGIAYSYYRLSPRTTCDAWLRQMAGMSMGDYVNYSQTHSAVPEACYGIPVVPALVILLEFEYVIRPG
ncbi:carbohydrate porin [Acetobacter senegalensis]|uniref:carbohydrate porin n=1 Tax=Acetobacter senegalensis TaxID=446692 RepID=UPI00264C54ED|nr:carbohydrate porin [Acetobacter senegalensis]MDN7353729.1 carbohydrate porin [Acetobacter senegalensis]